MKLISYIKSKCFDRDRLLESATNNNLAYAIMFNSHSMMTSSHWTLARNMLLILVSHYAYYRNSKSLSSLSKLARPVCVASLYGFVTVWTTLKDTQNPTNNSSCETGCAAICQNKDREYRYHNTFWSDVLWVALMTGILTMTLEIGIYLKERYDTEGKRVGKFDTQVHSR